MESGAANQRSVSKQSLNCTFTIELSASGDVTMPNKTSLMANRPQIRQWANFPTETEFIQIENRVRQPASCTGCRTLFFVFFSVFSLNLEKCWKLESKKKKTGFSNPKWGQVAEPHSLSILSQSGSATRPTPSCRTLFPAPIQPNSTQLIISR